MKGLAKKKPGGRPLSVCYYGSYDLSEPHNTTYLAGLKKVGIRVKAVHKPPLKNRDNANRYTSSMSAIYLITQFMINSLLLVCKLFATRGIDAVIVGYPGYFDLIQAKMVGWLRRIPVILNIHISLFETLVLDRKFYKKKSIMAGFLKWYDRAIIRLSNMVIVDTHSHAKYYSQIYNVSLDKFHRVFIGADPIFTPMEIKSQGEKKVLFYGTFIPLQGIEYIIQAADKLKNESDLKFEIIGRGQTKKDILTMAANLSCDNVEFIDWVSREALVQKIAAADICLGGQFGLTTKANLVIGYKCYQMMACKKAIIVSDSDGNRELLTHDLDCYMCRPGDPTALAAAILALKNSEKLQCRLAGGSRRTFEEKCSAEKIGAELHRLLSKVCRA